MLLVGDSKPWRTGSYGLSSGVIFPVCDCIVLAAVFTKVLSLPPTVPLAHILPQHHPFPAK